MRKSLPERRPSGIACGHSDANETSAGRERVPGNWPNSEPQSKSGSDSSSGTHTNKRYSENNSVGDRPSNMNNGGVNRSPDNKRPNTISGDAIKRLAISNN